VLDLPLAKQPMLCPK